MSFSVVIPARYASTRLPAKPLLKLLSKEMILWTAEKAKDSGAKNVLIATDHQEIFNVVSRAGFNVVMTSEQCRTGTDRVWEVVSQDKTSEKFYVNVQGDEPAIDPRLVNLIGKALEHSTSGIVTAAHFCSPAYGPDKNRVKAIIKEENGRFIANDFQRVLNASEHPQMYQHIGIYGYKKSTLEKLVQLESSPNEISRSLEQMRFLDNGFEIEVVVVPCSWVRGKGVDTAEDIPIVEKALLQSIEDFSKSPSCSTFRAI